MAQLLPVTAYQTKNLPTLPLGNVSVLTFITTGKEPIIVRWDVPNSVVGDSDALAPRKSDADATVEVTLLATSGFFSSTS